MTVIREADGRTYLSFVVQVNDAPAVSVGRACGIDIGLSSFAAVVSLDQGTGALAEEKVDSPLYLRRKERALARSQRALSRKVPGSKNRERARHKVEVQHRKVREARLDHAHRQAVRLVAGNDVICVEDLALAGMARTNLAKSVADQGLGQFVRLLQEKAERQGRRLVKVDRFFPSTQRCSACGDCAGLKGHDQVGVRQWTCRACGVAHDRDANAARNILAEGLRLLGVTERTLVAGGQPETVDACGAEVSPPEVLAAHGATPSWEEAGRPTGDRPCAA